MLIVGFPICCLIYAGYLSKTKRLPFHLKKAIKPEHYDDYLKVDVNFFIQVAVLFIIFQLLTELIKISNNYLYLGVLGIIYIIIYVIKVNKQRKYLN